MKKWSSSSESPYALTSESYSAWSACGWFLLSILQFLTKPYFFSFKSLPRAFVDNRQCFLKLFNASKMLFNSCRLLFPILIEGKFNQNFPLVSSGAKQLCAGWRPIFIRDRLLEKSSKRRWQGPPDRGACCWWMFMRSISSFNLWCFSQKFNLGTFWNSCRVAISQ